MSVDLWIQAAIAFGTVGAVIVALFGDWFRARFTPPRLILELHNTRGVKCDPTFVQQYGQPAHQTLSRWYHVRLSNSRRAYAPARETQLYLVSVEVPNAAGGYAQQWAGAIPLKIRDRGIVLSGNTIGPPIEYDLCSVIRETQPGGRSNLQLHPVVQPNQVTIQTDQPYKAILTLQARSIEIDSETLRIEIAWDGEWADDGDEMARHLVFTINPAIR